MIKIALLYDDELTLKSIVKKAEQELKQNDQITIFTNTEEFLSSIKSGKNYDILISDIKMPQINGIQVGQLCVDICPEMYIVFITAYSQYAAQSYALNAYQYIMKEDMEIRLPHVLNNLLKQIRKNKNKYRLIGTPTSKEIVYYRNIIYICKNKGTKYVYYVTTNGIYKERIAINQVMNELESDEFIMVERGYIININHITNMEKNIIYLDNGDKLVSSRAYFKNVKKQINIYRGNT